MPSSIARRVKLFNKAFRLAAKKLDSSEEGMSSETAKMLSEIITANVRAGADDPYSIADAAIEAIKQLDNQDVKAIGR